MRKTHTLVEREGATLVAVEDFASYGDAVAEFEKRDPEKFAVRSAADPNVVRRLDYVKLDRVERETLLDLGRRAGSLEAAKAAMFSELLTDARFEHLDPVELSDYAWAAAKFCFPREWEELR